MDLKGRENTGKIRFEVGDILHQNNWTDIIRSILCNI